MEKRALWAVISLATAIGCGDDSGGGAAGAGAGGTPTAGGMAVSMAGSTAAGSGGSTTAGTGAAGRGAAGTGTSGTGAAGRGTSGTGAAGMPAAGASAGTGATAGASGMAAGGTGGMVAAGTGGAAAGTGGAAGGGGGMFTLTSPVVMNNGMLPQAHRCVALGGETGPSPALMWTGGPAGTMSYALTLTDKGNGYAHWTIYDIPSSVMMLPMGVPQGASPAMPAGAKQSENQSAIVGGPGYFGPCAPTGISNYEFKIWALDTAMLGATATDAATVRAAIEMHDLGSATLGIMSGPPNAMP